ncbi:sugar phosphate isomerase/epimerase [soil metagenome]
MQLGFVSAILPDLSLLEVAEFAASAGFTCLELMCWPKGKAERRYAGVTHVDVVDFDPDAARTVKKIMADHGLTISGLGYYPNPLVADQAEAQVYIDHIKHVIAASALLEVGVMNTFIGRDGARSVEDNWPRFLEVWKPLIKFAEDHNVRVGIENCPMLFTMDEWPGGKNLATTPAIWRRMFEAIPSDNFGLNFDPSHLVWQKIDYLKAIRDFAPKFIHVHAKDARVDQHRLDEVGIMGTPLQFHTPKLPGLGDINWGQFFSVLSDAGYNGPVCIEVEDRAYEGALASRKASLVQSGGYLRQFMAEH